jgi:hypothetical protein
VATLQTKTSTEKTKSLLEKGTKKRRVSQELAEVPTGSYQEKPVYLTQMWRKGGKHGFIAMVLAVSSRP